MSRRVIPTLSQDLLIADEISRTMNLLFNFSDKEERRRIADEAERLATVAVRQDLVEAAVQITHLPHAAIQEQVEFSERIRSSASEVRGDIEAQIRATEGRMNQQVQVASEQINRKIKAAQQQAEEQDQAIIAHMHQTQERVNNHMGRLQQSISDLAQEQEQIGADVSQLAKNQQMTRNDVSRLDQAQQQTHEELVRLDTDLYHLLEKNAEIANRAYEWISGTGDFLNIIEDTYRTSMFAPGRVQQLDDLLKDATGNYDIGAYQVALAQGQAAYHQVSQLRLELEQKELAWNQLHLDVLCQAKHLKRLVDTPQVELTEINGKPTANPIMLDVNGWTNNGFGRLSAQLTELIKRLDDTDHFQELNTNALEYTRDNLLCKFSKTIEDVIMQARMNCIDAHYRHNLMNIMAGALVKQGFSVQKSGYEDNDFRKNLHIEMIGMDGSVQIIDIAPRAKGAEELPVCLDLITPDPRADYELDHMTENVRTALRYAGVTIGPSVKHERNESSPIPAVSEPARSPQPFRVVTH